MFFDKPKQEYKQNKTKRHFVRPKRRFGKISRRLVFLKRRFAFFADFCSNRASGELWF